MEIPRLLCNDAPLRRPEVKKTMLLQRPEPFSRRSRRRLRVPAPRISSVFVRWSPISPSPFSLLLFLVASSALPPLICPFRSRHPLVKFFCMPVRRLSSLARTTRYNATPGCIVDQSQQTSQRRCRRQHEDYFVHDDI